MVRLSNTVEQTMFYGAKSETFLKAKVLRENMTVPESLLFEKLRKNQILGLRFKAQHPINQFIVDFYCHKLKLVIEIDGEIHENDEAQEYDFNRTIELEKFGLKVVRFKNKDIIDNIDLVIRKINDICKEILKSNL